MVLVLKKGAGKQAIKALRKQVAAAAPVKGVNTKKHCGTLRLKDDPLAIQKQMRDEWQ